MTDRDTRRAGAGDRAGDLCGPYRTPAPPPEPHRRGPRSLWVAPPSTPSAPSCARWRWAVSESRERDLGRRLLLEAVGEVDDDRPATQFEVRRGTYCSHARVEICDEQREVACASCGAKLDPFDVLHGFATKERWLGHIDDERRMLQKKIDTMKAEERRVKARLRTANRAAPAERGEIEALRILESAARNQSYFTLTKPVQDALAKLDAVRAAARETGAGRG